jgi:N-acetylneuraminic acid mutarotase
MSFRAPAWILALGLSALPAGAAGPEFVWDLLPPLPPAAGQERQPGVASPFVGLHAGALLVAGGANFPGAMPWDGGAKAWWPDIWVLENVSGDRPAWVSGKTWALPRPIAYGVSVSTPEGVVCLGGNDADRCHAEVFLLAWDARNREVRRTPWPSLPRPLANLAGALVGTTLYVAGGQETVKGGVATRTFWSLDLTGRDDPARFRWRELSPWPGPERILPVAVAQGASGRERFFLFGGRVPRAGRPTELLTDAYVFDPRDGSWRSLGAIGGGPGVSVMAGVAAPVGPDEIWILGGDRGDRFRQLEAHDLEVERLKARAAEGQLTSAELDRATARELAAKRAIYGSHPGFGREVLAFNVRTGTWREAGLAGWEPQVTTLAVKVGDAIIVPSGEVRPGVRTPAIVRVRPTAGRP